MPGWTIVPARGPGSKGGAGLVQGATARHQGDARATRTLALADMHWGYKTRATTILDGLLVAAPDDADLLRPKAKALLAADEQASCGMARRLLVRAANDAPADWRALHLSVRTSDIQRGPVDVNLRNMVQRMWELAPQASGILIKMVTEMLEPAAFAPHSDGSATSVRSLHSKRWPGMRRH